MKRHYSRALILSLSLALGAVLALGCSDDSSNPPTADTGPGTDQAMTGPIDGVWLVTSLTCDGATQPLGTFTLTVNNKTGTFVQQFAPTCKATLDEDYEYPDNKTFVINAKTITCDPNTGCAAIFGGADCPPLPPKTDFAYKLEGSKLTFTRTASLPSDPCPTGQKVEFVMQKQ